MKKGLIIAVAALMLVLGMSGVVAAANEDNKTVTATYSVSQHYVITIPSEVAVSTAVNAYVVNATEVAIADGKKLVFDLSTSHFSDSKDHVQLTSSSKTSNVPYTITYKIDDGATNHTKSAEKVEEILNVPAGTAQGGTHFYTQTTTENIHLATLVGDHKDKLTFDVRIIPETP